MKEKIAIIGSGISGLSAAYILSKKYDVYLFEKKNRLGGHTRTINVYENLRKIPIDTGFIVFNEQNYPDLTKFFQSLKIDYRDSNMSLYEAQVHKISKLIMEGLNANYLRLEDESHLHHGHRGVEKAGDTHFSLYIVSSIFENKSLVQRHRVVYDCLKEPIKLGVHALKIKALTPEELKNE